MSLFSYRPKSEALTWDASAREVLGTEPPATLAEYLDLIHPEDHKRSVEGRGGGGLKLRGRAQGLSRSRTPDFDQGPDALDAFSGRRWWTIRWDRA